MQEEVDQKTIALAVKTGKLTAQVLQAAIRKYLAARQKGTGKAHHGQQSLRQLKKDGSALSNIEITDANIGLFKPCAKKYDIDFTLRKDRTNLSDPALIRCDCKIIWKGEFYPEVFRLGRNFQFFKNQDLQFKCNTWR